MVVEAATRWGEHLNLVELLLQAAQTGKLRAEEVIIIYTYNV
jgi:hypothetical protein